MGDEIEPISDDELLYRRIPESSNPQLYHKDSGLSPKAFRPNRNDTTGLSIYRAKDYNNSPKRAASTGRAGKKYYIAILRAFDIKQFCTIKPTLEPQNPGHAELLELRYDNARDENSTTLQIKLRDLCICVEGPFDGERVPDANE